MKGEKLYMILNIYSIKDVVVGDFMSPVLLHNDAEAVRALKETGLTKNALTDKAGDIQLWFIGQYNTNTGEITSNTPYLIGNLIDYLSIVKEGVSNE